MTLALSILDLVSVSAGQDAAAAIDASMRAARQADELGYTRLWFAEHHNTAAVASSATAVLVGRAAGLTSRIRVGSGGVMLPNHAPLMVAENYGTLATMFPGRIDLGLGRAPGTDQFTARALARSSAEPNAFVANVVDMHDWFTRGVDESGITVGVAKGTDVPMWVLGSSTTGAAMAAALGLPYSFASHFAPDQLADALHVYRTSFRADAPTASPDGPRVSVGVNVLCCDDEAEARHQFTTTQNMFLALRRSGGRESLQAPSPVAASPMEQQMMEHLLRVAAIGTPSQVASRLEQISQETGADELVTVTYAFDPEVRIHSQALVAEACGLPGA